MWMYNLPMQSNVLYCVRFVALYMEPGWGGTDVQNRKVFTLPQNSFSAMYTMMWLAHISFKFSKANKF